MSTIAPTLPARRSQLIVRPLGEAGQHVVKDPLNDAYYHLGPEESFLLLKLDGTATAEQVCREFEEEFDEPLAEEDLDDFLDLARSSHFIPVAADDSGAQPRNIGDVTAKQIHAPARPYEQSILYWRKPVFDPDRLFDVLEPMLRFIWTRSFLVISSLLI